MLRSWLRASFIHYMLKGVCACLQAQYMPLESQEGANGEAAQPLRAASNGGVGTV